MDVPKCVLQQLPLFLMSADSNTTSVEKRYKHGQDRQRKAAQPVGNESHPLQPFPEHALADNQHSQSQQKDPGAK